MVKKINLIILIFCIPIVLAAIPSADQEATGFKGIYYGVVHSSTSKGFTNEIYRSAFYPYGNEVWTQYIDTNKTKANATSQVICVEGYNLTEDTSVSAGWYDNESRQWIDFARFGNDYKVRVFEQDDTEIPSSADWLWFSGTGYVYFTGGDAGYSTPIKINACYYNGSTGVQANISAHSCTGSDKFSAYANGVFTCTVDETGAGSTYDLNISNGSTTNVINDSEILYIKAGNNISVEQSGNNFTISNIMTDSDTTYTAEEDLIYLDSTTFRSNESVLNGSIDSRVTQSFLEALGFNITSALKTYFDTLYQAVGSYVSVGDDQKVTIAGENVTSGTIDEARIDADIARDSELINNCSTDLSCDPVAYDSEINKTYVDNQDSAQDECSEITNCVVGAITDGNTGWDNSYGFFDNIDNFTDSLTDTKLCIYNATNDTIQCDYTDQTGASSSYDLNISNGSTTNVVEDAEIMYIKAGNNISVEQTGNNFTITSILTESDPLSVYKDGTVTLTANWDQGAYNLTNTEAWFLGWVNWSKVSGRPDTVNLTTNFGGEVSGTYDAITLSDTALDDQYVRNDSSVKLSHLNMTGNNITNVDYTCHNDDCSSYTHHNGTALVIQT